MDVTGGGRESMLFSPVVSKSVSRLTVEVDALMRLGIDELDEFTMVVQFMVDKLEAGVTVDGKMPEAPVTELC